MEREGPADAEESWPLVAKRASTGARFGAVAAKVSTATIGRAAENSFNQE